MCARKILDHDKNCVALALSDTLNIDINVLYTRLDVVFPDGDFTVLENTETIKTVLNSLRFTSVEFSSRSWSCVRAEIMAKGEGRYFAVNTNENLFDDEFRGHAFCMVLTGTKGPKILGNNASTETRGYLPNTTDNIYVWRPATPAVALPASSKPKKNKMKR